MKRVSGFGDVTDSIQKLLEPPNESEAYNVRVAKLREYGLNYPSFRQSDRDMIVNAMKLTQFDGETHRYLTPAIMNWRQQKYAPWIGTQRSSATSRANNGEYWDLILVGGGLYASAIASYVAEKRPLANILVLEKEREIGGQFSAYGSKPVFQMNSRVRPANRTIPGLPRTPGNINPVGYYAPLELSDIAMGQYAWNTEMADVVRWNLWLSATQIVVNVEVDEIADYSGYKKVTTTDIDDRFGSAQTYYGKCVVDCTGTRPRSTMTKDIQAPQMFEAATRDLRLFDTVSFYKHFGTVENPLERFHDQKVIVVGGGDSALTAMEALIGNLPAQTYGSSGPGRMRPAKIEWIGAPKMTRAAIDKCLRTRYKNGIVQNLPANTGDDTFIHPLMMRGRIYRAVTDGVSVRAGYDDRTVEGDILVDCTNSVDQRKADRLSNRYKAGRPTWLPTYRVGPYAQEPDYDALRVIEKLGIKENGASLWALMPRAMFVAKDITRNIRTN